MLLYLLFTSALACLSFAHPLQHDEESTKIIGGRNASIYDYPWHVALLNSNTSRHLCAGVIISRYAVLTIAQCVHTGHVDQVRIGTAYRAGGGYTRHIHRIVLHPKFNISISAWDHNIAIIILRNPVYYTPRIRSVALPRYRDDLAINATVTVTGWGWTDEPTETFPDVLQTADIQVIDRETCAERFRGVTDNMLCARHHNLSLVGPCFADAGGAAIYRSGIGSNPVVHGVIIGGNCVGNGRFFFTITTRVSRYVEWIRSIEKTVDN